MIDMEEEKKKKSIGKLIKCVSSHYAPASYRLAA
jgi:hypothetical protein